ncbi:conserved hypothetical protein [Methanocella paludicola SANAE]|uniref:Uncharacterized protein n=1 Tax=Methanocella paludicola (strain DSM 17711 / JCM 13418 / NBRC 101707 / SANAE) TaxID=304371 RepID=D1Z213_METPS|nr:conserved hypothetical protein [Methanocella paludicola SANAE]
MKIYVRERTRSKEGSRNPRFRVIASQGGELRFHADHLRKVDIETIAKDLGAHVVYLPERERSGKKKEE